MTPKDKTRQTLQSAGFTPDEAAAAVESTDLEVLREPVPVSLDGLSAADVLARLRDLRANGTAVVTHTLASGPLRETVVDAGDGKGPHAYAGAPVNGWRFTRQSLRMACRVAGWSTVEWLSTEPAKLRLS